VVVGAGFGGIAAVRALRRAPVEVILVDRQNYHLFSPLLYQVAAALLDPSAIAQPVRALLRRIRNARMWMAEVTHVDLERKVLSTRQGEIEYDYLLLAAGSVTNYFGNQSAAELALPLKGLPDALAVRNRILTNFEQARWTDDTVERRRLLTVAIVGGGPTGVEFAGSLSELVRNVLRKDFPGMDLGEVRVLLLEAGDSLLTAFAPRLRRAAEGALRRKGVEIRYRALVQQVAPESLELASGERMAVGAVVWTAGVRAPQLGAGLGLPVDRAGAVQVEPTLQLPGHPEVFVVGDMAALEQDGRRLPMLAPVAQQEARRAARNIVALEGGRPPQPFRYFDKGIMAAIGRNSGLAQVGPFGLSGFIGWAGWLFVHLLLIVSLRNRLFVFLGWTWDYLFLDRPVRLILRASQKARPEKFHHDGGDVEH
jgi:NADH dehydrogenase